ncbi:MAG: restriction endonuclease subunit S [Oscillospiraceae bacterium]|nr:restriction endonuclease subunit S [Oscillospiraceae bacterium]
MTSKLSSLCAYAKGKIAVESLSAKNYISTENMAPNKGGIVEASSLPAIQYVQQYLKGDILVSNIRPYFKKIWMAEYDGGCSNDVLVFRTNGGCDPTFLYYVLANDAFFEYATATAKGTKMPRGDKMAIMQYDVPCFDVDTQRQVGAVLRSLDDRIAVNKKINDNLEQQARTIYHERFERVSSDGFPSDWRVVPIGEVATISNRSFNPLKEPKTMLELYSIPAFDEARFPVFEPSTSIKSNKFIVDASCFMISKLNPATKRVWKPYCLTENAVCSTEFIVYKAKDESITDFLYSVISSASFYDFMCSHVTGSTGSRQRTTPSDTLQFKFVLPPKEEISVFTAIVQPMYKQIRMNAIENDKLKRLRDTLLPKLMSGEIDLSSIQF